MKKGRKLLLGLAILLLGLMTGCEMEQADQTTDGHLEKAYKTEGALPYQEESEEQQASKSTEEELLGRARKGADVSEDGAYTGKDEVSLYLKKYGHLPDNYITKRQAKELGWDSAQGNLWEVAPGKSIGGDYFGNYEGLLPEEEGRDYFECDIDYEGGRRNAKRIVYSDDGLIFYTEDHYESFEQLYGG